MARVAAVLGVLVRLFARDLRASWSLKGNNFFIASLIFLQGAGAFVYLVIGLVMLFPLSTDPLRRIPATRLALWPLDERERWALRALSPWVNPMTWLLAAMAAWALAGKVTAGLWALFAGLVAVGFASSSLPSPVSGGWRRVVPRMPTVLGQLVRKNLRELLSTLDFYCAAVLSVVAAAYRFAGLLGVVEPLPREAWVAVTGLTLLALSSHAQSLFGLDGRGGMVRYQLLPLSGWRILIAKDAALLLAVTLLTLPLAPLSGLAGAAATLAVGHQHSVKLDGRQARWRFSTGAPFVMEGLLQSVVTVAAAWSVGTDARLLAVWITAWAISTLWFGRRLDQALSR